MSRDCLSGPACCGCLGSIHDQLYMEYLLPQVTCFVSTETSTVVSRSGTRTINTYTDGVYQGQTTEQVPQTTDAPVVAVTETIDQELRTQTIGPVRTVTTTDTTTDPVYDPPGYADDPQAPGTYTTTTVRTIERTEVDTTTTRSLMLVFDVSDITTFGALTAAGAAVINYARLTLRAFSVPGTAWNYVIRGFHADLADLPTDHAAFNVLFDMAANTRTNSANIDVRDWLPSSSADSLVLLVASPADNSAARYEDLELHLRNLFTGGLVLRHNWRAEAAYNQDGPTRSWSLLRALPTVDFDFRFKYTFDQAGTAFQPHGYEFYLKQGNGDDALRLVFDFIALAGTDDPTYPAWLRPTHTGALGTLTVTGLGIAESFRVLAPWSVVINGFHVSLYDDTFMLSVAAGDVVGSADTDNRRLTVWQDGGSFYSGTGLTAAPASAPAGSALVLPRDPLTAPGGVTAGFSTSSPSVVLIGLGYQETESLNVIGADRTPYDPALVDTAGPKECEPAPVNCDLIGTDENFRLLAEINWGEYQSTVPIGNYRCSGHGEVDLGALDPTQQSVELRYGVDLEGDGTFTNYSPDGLDGASDTQVYQLNEDYRYTNGQFSCRVDGVPQTTYDTQLAAAFHIDSVLGVTGLPGPPNLTVTTTLRVQFYQLSDLANWWAGQLRFHGNIRELLAGENNVAPIWRDLAPNSTTQEDYTPPGYASLYGAVCPCNTNTLHVTTIGTRPLPQQVTRTLVYDTHDVSFNWVHDLGVPPGTPLQGLPEVTLRPPESPDWSADTHADMKYRRLVYNNTATDNYTEITNQQNPLTCRPVPPGEDFGGGFQGYEVDVRADYDFGVVFDEALLSDLVLKLRPQPLTGAPPVP